MINLEDNNQTAQEASTTASLIEHLFEIVETFEDLQTKIASKISEQLYDAYKSNLTKLKEVATILDTDSAPIKLLSSSKLGSGKFKSKLDSVRGEVVRARMAGKTITEISKTYSVSTSTISRFFKYYDSLREGEKKAIQRESVMDTYTRLEELFVLIKQSINRTLGSNDEVAVSLIKEMRGTIEDARRLQEKVATIKYNQVVEFLVGIIQQELPPERQQVVFQKAQDFNRTLMLTGGGTSIA